MFSGFLVGFVNGLLGTGGGILAVSILKKQNLEQNKAHATAVGLMFPLSLISLFIYWQKEGEFLSKYWIYFLPAIGGSFIGAFLLKKIKAEKLRFLFAIIIFYSAVRLLFN